MSEEYKPKLVNKYVDLPVVIPPTRNFKVKVVCKKHDCNVDASNEFTWQWVGRHFTFNIYSGWMLKTVNKEQRKNDSNNGQK